MPTNSRDIIRRLRDEGWTLVRIEGSHHQFKRAGTREIITVPHPKKDLPRGTARHIAKLAGWV
ncbi:MAG: type II toxin-antitoxin system HicA family toxin [Beijerinckiaceae bacterium]|nr:type II toxin-antitoxin system HicA family toxin [Beijerinckiaceae bacterium]